MGAPDHARARLGLARPHRALGAAGVRHLYRRHGGPTAPFSLSERHGAGCCGRVASWSCRAAAGRGGSRASRGRGRAGASGRAASRVLVCRLFRTCAHAPWFHGVMSRSCMCVCDPYGALCCVKNVGLHAGRSQHSQDTTGQHGMAARCAAGAPVTGRERRRRAACREPQRRRTRRHTAQKAAGCRAATHAEVLHRLNHLRKPHEADTGRSEARREGRGPRGGASAADGGQGRVRAPAACLGRGSRQSGGTCPHRGRTNNVRGAGCDAGRRGQCVGRARVQREASRARGRGEVRGPRREMMMGECPRAPVARDLPSLRQGKR